MNFVISFSLLLTMPISGQMLDSLGSTALSGLHLVVVFIGGLLVFTARSTLVGSWFNFASKIWRSRSVYQHWRFTVMIYNWMSYYLIELL